MTEISIYQFVKEKLIIHGVENTPDGQLTLTDLKLFSLFVDLERAARESSFDAVQSASSNIEKYLSSLEKRQLIAFVYMYFRFSNFTPSRILLDEHLEDGGVRKCNEFKRQISDEEALIGLWASVKYHQVGERLLGVVYSRS
ncbi:hypothetical protein [Vannielia sp.]|uniref:hypothetical protein n=1 Tax=Vannielia sp. TaxID=2813045 RepID=UPI002615EC3D|nr:hypothetical protein [Vannielia sp.]MDF1872684.1 hypothetical protein [Vannielia sp.]